MPWRPAALRRPLVVIDEVLEVVGLRERGGDKVSRYSLGMKQRLGIAGALLNDPKLLLLDEPSNGLDPAGIVAMRDMLRHLAAIGKTVFISSHLLAEVQQMADVVGIIAAGRLVREGSMQELLAGEGVVRVRVEPTEVAAAAAALGRLTTPERVLASAGEAGWISVQITPDRSAEVNRTLAERGHLRVRRERRQRPRGALPHPHRHRNHHRPRRYVREDRSSNTEAAGE